MDGKWRKEWLIAVSFMLAVASVSAERVLKETEKTTSDLDDSFFLKLAHFFWQPEQSPYHHVWPPMKFGWKIILGSMIGFVGAAFGSVGGVGGGGFFVPMLTLIIGFDTKSSTAISKFMIMGAAAATVSYNLRQRHPTLDMPMIDYDLALLIQPMLMLGVSIGVGLNVIFANWMVTVLLIIIFLGISIKSFLKGVQTWKKESLMKMEAAKSMETNGTLPGTEEADCRDLLNSQPAISASDRALDNAALKKATSTADRVAPVPDDATVGTMSNNHDQVVSVPDNAAPKKSTNQKVPILENVGWKEVGLLAFVWGAFLALQITKSYSKDCSKLYWTLNMLQIPVSVGVSLYEAVGLYRGKKVIASIGNKRTDWTMSRLCLYCLCGILAGLIGGLLGLGGGTILGPLFLELGVPPQVSSATSTFAMTFSSSMSVVEYYLLKRFPVPYSLYFFCVAVASALIGQHVVGNLIKKLGRASLIVFVLALTIFVSAILLGSVGLSNMAKRIDRHEYMGFADICKLIN